MNHNQSHLVNWYEGTYVEFLEERRNQGSCIEAFMSDGVAFQRHPS